MTVGSNDIVLFVKPKLFCHSERLMKNLAKRSHEHIENKIKNVSNLISNKAQPIAIGFKCNNTLYVYKVPKP